MNEKQEPLILRNYYEIIKMPKTTAKVFKDLHVGEVICIELELENKRGYRNTLYAMYPTINGERTSGISTINNLISNGMELRELDMGEVARLVEFKNRIKF